MLPLRLERYSTCSPALCALQEASSTYPPASRVPTTTTKTRPTTTSLHLQLQQDELLGVPSCNQLPKRMLPPHLAQPEDPLLRQVLDVFPASMLPLSPRPLQDVPSGLLSLANLRNPSIAIREQTRHSPRTTLSKVEVHLHLHTANVARAETEEELPLVLQPIGREERAEMPDAEQMDSTAKTRMLPLWQERPSLV
jgi:hypothetical protein